MGSVSKDTGGNDKKEVGAQRGGRSKPSQEHCCAPLSIIPHQPPLLIAPLSFLLLHLPPPFFCFPSLPTPHPRFSLALSASLNYVPRQEARILQRETHRPHQPHPDTQGHMCPELFSSEGSEASGGKQAQEPLFQVPETLTHPYQTSGIPSTARVFYSWHPPGPIQGFILTRGHPTTDHIMFTSTRRLLLFQLSGANHGLRIM